jgi:hypothetical protein
MKTEWDKLVELAGSEEELLRILKLPGIREKVREEMLRIGKDNLNKKQTICQPKK